MAFLFCAELLCSVSSVEYGGLLLTVTLLLGLALNQLLLEQLLHQVERFDLSRMVQCLKCVGLGANLDILHTVLLCELMLSHGENLPALFHEWCMLAGLTEVCSSVVHDIHMKLVGPLVLGDQ